MFPWRKLVALPARDWGLLAETALVLTMAKAGLRLLPYGSLQRIADKPAGKAPIESASGTPARIAWALGALARRLPGRNTCLVQALAAHAMLRRRGYASELRIGVAGKDPAGGIQAHAWVECEGRVVIGGIEDLGTYAVLSAPPGS